MKGFNGRKACVERMMVADPVPSEMTIETDHQELLANEADQIRVVVRARDQVGNTLPYFHDPLSVNVRGAARLIGPDTLTFQGGLAAFWIESIGMSGEVSLSVTTSRLGTIDHFLSSAE